MSTSIRWSRPSVVWYRITRTLRRSRWARYSWYGCGLAWIIMVIYCTLGYHNNKQRLGMSVTIGYYISILIKFNLERLIHMKIIKITPN